MISIGITTSYRPNPLIDETIISLRKGGFRQKIYVFADYGAKIPEHENIEVFSNEEKKGCAYQKVKVLQYLLENTDSPWLMSLEDDIECVNSAYKHISSFCFLHRHKEVGFASGYTPVAYSITHPEILKSSGWIEFNRGRDTWGTQCIIMPRKSASMFIQSDFLQTEIPTDSYTGTFFKKKQMPCYYAVPSLFEHKGLTNSVHNTLPDEKNVGLRYGETFQSTKIKI